MHTLLVVIQSTLCPHNYYKTTQISWKYIWMKNQLFSSHIFLCSNRTVCDFIDCVPTQGKSLSVICGALKWLVDCEERDRQREEQILSGNPSTSATSTQSKEDASTGIYLTLGVRMRIMPCASKRDTATFLRDITATFVSDFPV